MDRRLNKRVDAYITNFKEDVREKMTKLGLTTTSEGRQLLQYIYDYEVQQNESNRTIYLINSAFVPQFESQLLQLMSQ